MKVRLISWAAEGWPQVGDPVRRSVVAGGRRAHAPLIAGAFVSVPSRVIAFGAVP